MESTIYTKYPDLKLNVSVFTKNRYNIAVSITLFNNSTNDYYINRDNILLDGFQFFPFRIRDETNSIQCYEFHAVYKTDKFFLKSKNSVTNSLNLADICDFRFAYPGVYSLSYSFFIFPCLDYDEQECYKLQDLSGTSDLSLSWLDWFVVW